MTLLLIAAAALALVAHVTDDSESRRPMRNYFDPTNGGMPPLQKRHR
ncbi:MAG: hypothetical protein AB7T06_24670 [Kofleriaceae bacterium]